MLRCAQHDKHIDLVGAGLVELSEIPHLRGPRPQMRRGVGLYARR